MGVKLTNKQQDLLIRFSIVQQNLGLTPALAKVNALLTISDEDKLSFDQIRETLNLSKSTTSNALNRLLMMGVIKYNRNGIDRKRYFYSDFENWSKILIKTKYPLLIPQNIKKIDKMIQENKLKNHKALEQFIINVNVHNCKLKEFKK